MIANTPKPPYYAVIFSSMRTEIDENYSEAIIRMAKLANDIRQTSKNMKITCQAGTKRTNTIGNLPGFSIR